MDEEEKYYICYLLKNFVLQSHAIWIDEHRSDLQRVMMIFFYDMMRKEIKISMDNMIAKFKKGDDHVQTLRKLFKRLRKY